MTELDTLPATREAYDTIAPVYARMFHDTLRDRPLERALLSVFAELVRANGEGDGDGDGDADRGVGSGSGEVADLGCGPGHITPYLHGLGLRAFGVDASPAMIGLAREANPELRFEVGSMAALDIEDGALGGVLSRWSVIHTLPQDVPAVLAEIARVLAPGGHLLISFPATDGPQHETQAYDHAVVTAYRWSPDRLAGLLRDRGLAEVARTVIEPTPTDPRQFQEVQLLARKA
ncbi:class I SAM-dependent methyltransferase [Streptomyces sp. NPDC012623]|uniref:class I SAM-dependent methyltransferase n=1 Tax=unclassified Streptomyces TaxID=2593676 RepID=UPI00369A1987